jgi:hypothetical protein
VASRTWLSDQQKRRAAWIAREKSLSCPDCGSSEPVPGDEARAHPGGGADVVMRCVNCKSASETTSSSLLMRQRPWPRPGAPRRLRDALRTSHDHAFAGSPYSLLHGRCTSTPPATGRSSLIRSFSCNMQVLRSGADGIRTHALRRAKSGATSWNMTIQANLSNQRM